MPIMILMNHTPSPDNGQLHSIHKILSKNLSGGQVLAGVKGTEPKALIVFLDYLSPHEKQLIESSKHRIVDLEDDLLKTLAELHQENIHLRSVALIDNLTGLYNNRFFRSQLETEMARTRRTGLPCCLLMIDLDNFKKVNDTLGHLEGDRFLSEAAKAFSQSVRATDIVCRYGGDEFVAILPSTRLFVAIKIANRLRKTVPEIPGATGCNVSASIGIAEFSVSSPWTADEFIQAADAAMYDAKSKGRNQIAVKGHFARSGDGLEPVSQEERKDLFNMYKNAQHQGESDEK